jgi:hypothetical protein
MTSLYVLKLPSGRTIEAEVSPLLPSVGSDGSRSDEFSPVGPGRATRKVLETTLDVKESLSAVAELSDSIIDQFLQAVRKPEEVALEVSLKVGATGNLIIAGGSIEGAIKIAVKYKASIAPA